MKEERLREAVKQVKEGRATAAVFADVVRREILTEHRLHLASHRVAKSGSTVKPLGMMALLAASQWLR